jgi:hypothetical protein
VLEFVMASLNFERNIDPSSLSISHATFFSVSQRARRYLNLCSLSEDEVDSILQSLEQKMLDKDLKHLNDDELMSLSMQLLQELLPTFFNEVREQRCKPNAELRQVYPAFIQTGSLRTKTCPDMQRSSIGSASLERISFNFGKFIS